VAANKSSLCSVEEYNIKTFWPIRTTIPEPVSLTKAPANHQAKLMLFVLILESAFSLEIFLCKVICFRLGIKCTKVKLSLILACLL
jgi:hypothetical protein